jgi:hypothetical protein
MLVRLDLPTHFLEEIEVDTISLFLSDKEVALFKASGDSSNVHWFRFSHRLIDNGARHGIIQQNKILVPVFDFLAARILSQDRAVFYPFFSSE